MKCYKTHTKTHAVCLVMSISLVHKYQNEQNISLRQNRNYDLSSGDSHWKSIKGKINTKGHPASRYLKNIPKNYVDFE